MSGPGIIDALLHNTHIKVLLVLRLTMLDISRSIISWSLIAHQMWCNHPFSQRSKTTERIMGVGSEVTGKWGDKIWKRGVSNTGCLHKMGGGSTPLPTKWGYFKNFPDFPWFYLGTRQAAQSTHIYHYFRHASLVD